MQFNHIKVPSTLLKPVEHAYDDESADHKKNFHIEAKKILKKIADQLELSPKDYSIETNMAGIAMPGETTLHANSVYVKMSNGMMSNENMILFRECKSTKDFSGGQNNFISIADFSDEDRQVSFLEKLEKMVAKNLTQSAQLAQEPARSSMRP